MDTVEIFHMLKYLREQTFATTAWGEHERNTLTFVLFHLPIECLYFPMLFSEWKSAGKRSGMMGELQGEPCGLQRWAGEDREQNTSGRGKWRITSETQPRLHSSFSPIKKIWDGVIDHGVSWCDIITVCSLIDLDYDIRFHLCTERILKKK